MKKMITISKMLTLLAVLIAFMFSCVEDNYDKPDIEQIPIGEVYTIQQVKDFYNNNNGDYTFSGDASVYGTVTMDEETDNSYKTPFIQDHTGGVAVFLNNSGGLYIGDSVRVYLKDLKIMKYNNLFQINDVTGSNGVDVDLNIIKQGYNNKRVPEEVTLAEIIESSSSKQYYQGRLVKISDVQFVETDTSKTYYWENDQYGENKLIQDSVDNQIIVRTSSYSTFADTKIPDGSGSLIAIVSQYNNDMQLIIRRSSEVEMSSSRFNVNGGGSGSGSGTFEDPYDVAHAIANNSGENVWVEGYIVGVYETNVDPYAPSFTAPFVTNSNMIIAGSDTETNIDNCIVVQLPAGDIRNPLNLVDNQSNLGKQVKLLGDLTSYFGDEGLKNTTGYWMDGTGIIPETGFYEEDFSSTLGTFTAHSVNGTQVWEYASYDNGCATMSGYYSGSNYANEDWLVSGQIDLSSRSNVTLVIREAINYITTYDDVQVLVSTDYDGTSDPSTQGTWTTLTGFTRPAGNSWDFSASSDIDLSAYDGQGSFYLAFKYVSSTSGGATWEVGNVLLKESSK